MVSSESPMTEPRPPLTTSFRIKAQYTFSWWVLALFLVPSLGSNMILDAVRLGGTWLDWLPIAIATYAVTGLSFGFAKYAKKRWTPNSGLVYALGTYLLIGWLRGITAYFLALELHLGTVQDLLFRLISPPIFAFVGLAIFAALITTIMEQRDALREARAERAHLENAVRNYQSQHDRMRDELLERVSATIGPAIADLRQKLGAPQTEQSTRQLLAEMQVTAETIVRPLSHELATTEVLNLQLDTSGSFSTIGSVARMKFYEPELMPGWGAMLSIAMQLPALAVNYNIVDAAMTVFLLGFSLFINLKVLEGYTAHFRLTPIRGAFIVIGGYIVAGLTAPMFWDKTHWALSGPERISFTLIVMGIAVAIYVIGLANASRTRYIAESFAVVEKMAELLSQLRQQVWLDRRRVATVLHGPLQGALQSGAIRLGRSGATEGLGTRIRADVQEALDQLQVQFHDNHDFEDVLDQIVALWEDVVDFRIRLDEAVREKLSRKPGASETAIELIRESVNNAMKHSRPTEIDISLTEVRPGVIQIRVCNNGAQLDGEVTKGYGSQLFDELCLDWSLENVDGGVCFEAKLVA